LNCAADYHESLLSGLTDVMLFDRLTALNCAADYHESPLSGLTDMKLPYKMLFNR